MATTKGIGYYAAWGILGGIAGWFLASLLDATAIFDMIPALPEIGLFLGFALGVFKDKLE